MDPRTGRTLSTNRIGRLAMPHIARLIEHRFPNLLVKPAKVLVAASSLLTALGMTRAILACDRHATATPLAARTGFPHTPTPAACACRPLPSGTQPKNVHAWGSAGGCQQVEI